MDKILLSGIGFDNLPAVDMHIHTVHCGHCTAEMTLGNIIRRAEQLGLEQIAVTDHVWNEQQLAMLDVIEQEFETLEPQIRVRLGAEVDIDPRYGDGRLIEQVRPCFRPLIIATHAYPQSTLMWYDDGHVSGRTKRSLLKKWFRWVTAAVGRDNVDVLAHPGVLVSREGPELRFEAEILDRFSDLFGVMRAHDVAFEINEHVKCKLLSQGQLDTYHNLPALAGELGVKFSVGSDSHDLCQIGQLQWASEISRRAGLGAADFPLYNGPGLVKNPPTS